MARRQVISCPWQDEQGNVLALGTIVFEASGDALVTGTGELCAGIKGSLTLDNNGQVAASPAQYMWPTDQMSPSNITYTVWVYSANGQIAWGPNYGLTVPSGAGSFNLCTWVPNQIGAGSGAAAGSLTLQVEGVNNAVQSLLNLESTDGSVTITDEGNGSVNFQSGGGITSTTPFSNYSNSLSSISPVQNGKNTLTIIYLFVQYAVKFKTINLNMSGGTPGPLFNLGIYQMNSSLTQATKLCEIGPTTPDGIPSLHTFPITAGEITLPPGLYLFVMTGTSNSNEPTIVTITPEFIGFSFSSADVTAGAVLPAIITVVPSTYDVQTGSGNACQPFIGLRD